MKAKILSLAILSIWSVSSVVAQDRTTVTANNPDISDNLDLRAVASIFGDSRDLDDFERKLNDPRTQISNLDLNGDNRVDYLRVIESVEGNAHLIIIQSVLGVDTFQDIATVEVERDRYNKVQVQVVGDVYMYGNNYIYEPVYAYTPVIYTSFWVRNYRPYCSSWYWGYYPSFYIAWTPFPIHTYHSNIGIYINHNHYYNYVDYRRCSVAYNNYYHHNGRRGSAYERQHPTRSFSQRNTGYVNRREMVGSRSPEFSGTRSGIANGGTRANSASGSTRSTIAQTSVAEAPRTYGNTRNSESPRTNGSTRNSESPRTTAPSRMYGNTGINGSPRTYGNTRSSESPRTYESTGTAPQRSYGNTRSAEAPRATEPSRTYGSSRNSETQRTYGSTGVNESQRTYGNTRSAESSGTKAPSRTYGNTRNPESSGGYESSRSYESPRSVASQGSSRVGQSQRYETPGSVQRNEAPGNSAPRDFSQQRGTSQRSEGNSRGNRRS